MFHWKLSDLDENWGTQSILFAAGPGKGHIAVSHLSNYIEPSVYGGDAPYVKLLSPLVIFGLPHRRHSRTDSQTLPAEYCIVCIPHNTAI